MAEATAIIGTAASIISLAKFGQQFISRLGEFQSKLWDPPASFQPIIDQLPLILAGLEHSRTVAEAQSKNDEVKRAVLKAIDGCREQIRCLDDMITRALPGPEDTGFARGRKALVSIWNDEEVAGTMKNIHDYSNTIRAAITGHSASFDSSSPSRIPSEYFSRSKKIPY